MPETDLWWLVTLIDRETGSYWACVFLTAPDAIAAGIKAFDGNTMIMASSYAEVEGPIEETDLPNAEHRNVALSPPEYEALAKAQ